MAGKLVTMWYQLVGPREHRTTAEMNSLWPGVQDQVLQVWLFLKRAGDIRTSCAEWFAANLRGSLGSQTRHPNLCLHLQWRLPMVCLCPNAPFL